MIKTINIQALRNAVYHEGLGCMSYENGYYGEYG